MGTFQRAFLMVSLLSLVAVGGAAAQDCYRCYDREDGTGHVFGSAPNWYSYMWADCNALNACHGNSQAGTCSGNHWGCGVSLAMLLERLNTSIVRGDVARTGALIAANPTRVKFDPATGRVAIRDCDGRQLMAWNWRAGTRQTFASRVAPSANIQKSKRVA
jgi:hypothetical protein